MKRIALAVLILCGTAFAQQPVNQGQTAKTSGSLTATAAAAANCGATSCVTVSTTGYGSATITVHGTYAGSTINFEFSDDGGTTYYPFQCAEANASVQESSKTLGSNSSIAFDCGVYATTNFEVRQSAIGSGTAVVNVTLSAAPIEPAPTVSASGNFKVNVQDGSGNLISSDATGRLNVAQSAHQQLKEDFSAAVDARLWSTSSGTGGTSPTWTTDSGSTTLSAGTTVNGYSLMATVPAFRPQEPGFVQWETRNQVLSNSSTTTYSYWGLGNAPATPTVANPVVDGCGFDELQGTAHLFAVCYQGASGTTGTRVVIQDLSASTINSNNKATTTQPTQPADLTATHKYGMLFSGALAYWLIDGVLVAEITTGANGPNNNNLTFIELSVSNSGTANTLTVNGLSIGDTSKRIGGTVCDPTYGFSCANVLQTLNSLKTDMSSVAGTATATGNGTSGAGNQRVNVASDNTAFETIPVTTATTTDTASRCTLVSAASTNSTSCKGSAGNVYGFRFINTTTTVYYLRMYNSSSAPTCSSATGFIETIPIPPAGASGQAGGVVAIEPMGEGYTTGIGFCFTGGSSSTDNTNAATGVFGTILYK